MNLVRVSNGAGVGTVPNFDVFAWCFLPREFLELAQTNSKAQGLGSLVAAVSGIAQSRTRLNMVFIHLSVDGHLDCFQVLDI